MGAAYIVVFLVLMVGAQGFDDFGWWAVIAPTAGWAFVGLALHLVPGWRRFGSGLLWTTAFVFVAYWAFLGWWPVTR